jgi:hypothetical protein
MEIPEKLTIVDGFYFTDGGTIVLLAEEPGGGRHQITLGQHRILEYFDPNVLPGRLYFNDLLVPVRSEIEVKVIELLQAGEIVPVETPEPKDDTALTAEGPVVIVGDDLKEYYAKEAEGKGETIRHLIEQLIRFVESREYIRVANKIEEGGARGH